MKHTIFTFSMLALFLASCSTIPRKSKVILDSSSSIKPKWTNSSKTGWEEKGRVYLKATHTVQGNERANGCIDLAKLDAKEDLISEIQNEIRGSLDNAQESISEDAEVILGKARSAEFSGKISGLRFVESYWEKYQIGRRDQKLTCHVLAQIKMRDYMQTKRAVVNKVMKADPKLREAVTKKQINFFNPRQTASTGETGNAGNAGDTGNAGNAGDRWY